MSDAYGLKPTENMAVAEVVPNPQFAIDYILQLTGEKGPLLSIHRDGSVTFGPDFTTTEAAALAFWKELAKAFPAFRDWAKSEL